MYSLYVFAWRIIVFLSVVAGTGSPDSDCFTCAWSHERNRNLIFKRETKNEYLK
jgi:hypothetical protein